MVMTRQKRKKKFKILLGTFIILFITSVYIMVRNLLNEQGEQEIYGQNVKEQSSYIYNAPQIKEEESKVSEKIVKLQKLQEINSDVVALIEIEGTNINYPVLQTDNNSYYINHNYKKEKDKDGAIFLDKEYNWELPSTNLLIYGHNNIGSSEMFASLTKYKKESFYKKHKIINFITNDEEAKYEIISVFLSKVYYKHETNVFRYYYFINADNKKEFDDYVKNCKSASLYETDITAEYGDQLMTLSTCEYSKLNGRLAVVARKIIDL